MGLLQTKRYVKYTGNQKPNETGIPLSLKQDFEARSGLSYDDVRIHYSSDKPAELERQADRGIVEQCAQAFCEAPSPIIQRKIGMEFQTVGGRKNVFVRAVGEKVSRANTSHGDVLCVTANGTMVTADGSDLEYVTPPVEKAAEARTAGGNAGRVHCNLKQGNAPRLCAPATFYKKWDKAQPYCEICKDEKIYTLKNLGDTAHPQATVGIRMDKVSELFTALGGKIRGKESYDRSGKIKLAPSSGKLPPRSLSSQKKTMREAPAEAKAAVDQYLTNNHITRDQVEDYDNIVGLLSLLIAYNKQFLLIEKKERAAWNAKNAMPVMSRTSLYDVYLKLKTEDDRKVFRGSIELVRWNAVPEASVHGLEGQTILAGQRGDDDGQPWETVSLDDWMEGLDHGRDEMYGRFDSVGSLANPGPADPAAAEKTAMLAKFGMARSTDIGIPDRDGILAELRGLERQVPYSRWGEVAEQIALLVNRLNGVPET